MENSKHVKQGKRNLVLLLGIIVIGFGASLFMEGNLGADGFNVFNLAVAIKLDIMPGTVNVGLSIIYLILIFCVAPKYRSIGTVISTFVLGSIINVFLILLGYLNIAEWNFLARCVITLLGCNFAALGIALGFVSEAGMHPNDIIPILIAEKIQKNYKLVRVIYDLTYAFVGILLGGVVGLGTAFTIMIIGPISKKYMDILGKKIKF